MKSIINYANVENAESKAIQDCKNYLGESTFEKLIDIIQKAKNEDSVFAGLGLLGIEGFPANVLVNTYFNK